MRGNSGDAPPGRAAAARRESRESSGDSATGPSGSSPVFREPEPSEAPRSCAKLEGARGRAAMPNKYEAQGRRKSRGASRYDRSRGTHPARGRPSPKSAPETAMDRAREHRRRIGFQTACQGNVGHPARRHARAPRPSNRGCGNVTIRAAFRFRASPALVPTSLRFAADQRRRAKKKMALAPRAKKHPSPARKTGQGSPLVLVHGTGADHTRWGAGPRATRRALHCLRDWTVAAEEAAGDAPTYAIEPRIRGRRVLQVLDRRHTRRVVEQPRRRDGPVSSTRR